MSILDSFNEWSAVEIMGWDKFLEKDKFIDWNPLENLNHAMTVVREMAQYGPPVTITNVSMGVGFTIVRLDDDSRHNDWAECGTPEEMARAVCYYTMNYILDNQNKDNFPFKVRI